MPNRLVRGAAAFTAAIVALGAPMLAQAHDYRRYYYDDGCSDRIHNNGVAGALFGGAAGAVIGSNLASHGGRTGGTLLGAAAGAAVGSNIARSTTKDRCRGPRVVYSDYPPPRPIYVAPRPIYVAPPPPAAYGYEIYDDGPHDRGLHRGWYKHHHDEDDDD